MGKTVRRKNYYDHESYRKTWDCVDGIWGKYDMAGAELERSQRKLHGDTKAGYGWSAPAYFRRAIGRHRRNYENQKLREAIRDGALDDLAPVPWKNNAIWEYW